MPPFQIRLSPLISALHQLRKRFTGQATRPYRGQGFALNHHVGQRKLRFHAKTVDVFLRMGTIDEILVDMILHHQGEYRLHASVEPRVIFDIGANIGIATLYFALVYPQARIYSFEPLPQNLEMLRANVKPFADRVTVLPYGLSDQAGSFAYCMSDDPINFGGGGFVGDDPLVKAQHASIQLPVKTVAQAIARLNIDCVDVFKIDTEGSEYRILQGMPEHIRQQAQAIVGELHGQDDWRVCQMLDTTHALAMTKRLENRCFLFEAVHRDVLSGGRVTPLPRVA